MGRVRLATILVALPLVTGVRKRRVATACGSCSECVAVPGNGGGATDGACAPCANNGQSWWPCNGDGLCQCAGGSGPSPTPPSPTPPSPSPPSPALLDRVMGVLQSSNHVWGTVNNRPSRIY